MIPCDTVDTLKLFDDDVQLYLVVIMDNDWCRLSNYKNLICDSTKYILGKVFSAYLRLGKYVDIDFLKRNNKQNNLYFNFKTDEIFIPQNVYENGMHDVIERELKNYNKECELKIITKKLCHDIAVLLFQFRY